MDLEVSLREYIAKDTILLDTKENRLKKPLNKGHYLRPRIQDTAMCRPYVIHQPNKPCCNDDPLRRYRTFGTKDPCENPDPPDCYDYSNPRVAEYLAEPCGDPAHAKRPASGRAGKRGRSDNNDGRDVPTRTGSRRRSPPSREWSNPGTPRAGTPQQDGVIYDQNEQPLPGGTIGQTGQAEQCETIAEVVENIMSENPWMSREEFDEKWLESRAARIHKWSMGVQK